MIAAIFSKKMFNQVVNTLGAAPHTVLQTLQGLYTMVHIVMVMLIILETVQRWVTLL